MQYPMYDKPWQRQLKVQKQGCLAACLMTDTHL
jgi:hypothetical protein